MNSDLKRLVSKLTAVSNTNDYFLYLKDVLDVRFLKKQREKIIQSGMVTEPFPVTIEPTLRCNLRCFMCFQSKFRQDEKEKIHQAEISAKEWKKFLRKTRPLISQVGLIGGEIFVRDDIFQFFDEIEKLAIPFHFTSNGVLINEKIAQKLVGYKCLKTVCLSIHGSEKIHDQVVGASGTFKKLKEAIRSLRGKHFWLAANCVISEKNLKELPQVVKECALVGFDSLGFQLENFATPEEERLSRFFLKKGVLPGFVQLKAESKYPYSFASLLKTWQLVKASARKSRIPVTFSSSSFYRYPEAIYSGGAKKDGFKLFCEDLLGCRIDPAGNVIACQFLPQSFGNVKNQPLQKIWNSFEFRRYRKNLLKNNLMEVCKRCCKLKLLPE